LNLETFVVVFDGLVLVALIPIYIAYVIESRCGVDTAGSFDLLLNLEAFAVVFDGLVVVALIPIYLADVVES